MQTLLKSLFGAERISWRRLFAFVLIIAASTGLLWVAKLDGSQWVMVVQWIGGAFIGVDGAERVASVMGQRPKE